MLQKINTAENFVVFDDVDRRNWLNERKLYCLRRSDGVKQIMIKCPWMRRIKAYEMAVKFMLSPIMKKEQNYRFSFRAHNGALNGALMTHTLWHLAYIVTSILSNIYELLRTQRVLSHLINIACHFCHATSASAFHLYQTLSWRIRHKCPTEDKPLSPLTFAGRDAINFLELSLEHWVQQSCLILFTTQTFCKGFLHSRREKFKNHAFDEFKEFRVGETFQLRYNLI